MKTKSSSMTLSDAPPVPRFPTASALLVMTPEDANRTVERLQRWVTDVNSFLGHVQAFLVHAFVPTLKLAVLAALVSALGRIAWPRLRRQLWPLQWAGLRIVPGADSRYDPTAWLRFYRALYGMATPAWKRLIEPPRENWRLHSLRGWSNVKTRKVPPRAT